MKFWYKNERLRMGLMIASFILGLCSVFGGLSFKGQLLGVGIMLIGLALLLFVLWLYNKPFTNEKK